MRLHTAAIAGVLLLYPVGAALRADDGELLFADDFSTFKLAGKPEVGLKIEGNKLVCTPSKAHSRTMLYPQKFGDVNLRVKITRVKGETGASGSVVFWAAGVDDLYKAELYSSGTFQVARRTQGKWVYPVLGRKPAVVKPTLGEVNELRVITSGDQARIELNGTQVAAFRGFPPAGETQIGFAASSGDEPFTWTFSDLSVRRGPLPTAVRPTDDKTLIFADDFSTLDPSWGLAGELASGGDHKLAIQPKSKTAFTRFYNGQLFDEGDVRVKVVQAAGGDTNPAGLVFWGNDYKNYHVLWVFPSGTAKISARTDGTFRTVAIKQNWAAVNKGLGAVNELRVVFSGRQAVAYVNGKRLGDIEVPNAPGWRQLGVSAESGEAENRWEFSNFVVREPTDDPFLLPSDSPAARAVIGAVGSTTTEVLAKFGAKPDDLLIADATAKDPTVVINYGGFAFGVSKTEVLSAYFWANWTEDTFRSVKLGDDIDAVTQKLGKAPTINKDADGAERHNWEFPDEDLDVQIIFAKQKCARVVVNARE